MSEASLQTEVALANHAKDLINGGIGRESTVEDSELSFQSSWNVIPASPGMDHSC